MIFPNLSHMQLLQIICLFYLLTKFYGFAVSNESVLIFCDLQRTPHLTTHPVMDQNLYWSALNTIYAKSMRINPKYPPESGEGSGGSRAGSGGPIRTRETCRSNNTCSSSGRRQMDGSRDEWIEWEPLLAAALASLHSADLVSIVEVDQVSALFKRSATHVALRLFLGKNLQSDQVKIIREMLENPPAV